MNGIITINNGKFDFKVIKILHEVDKIVLLHWTKTIPLIMLGSTVI